MDKYVDIEDVEISKEVHPVNKTRDVYDSEGDVIWSAPESFSDKQIIFALGLANTAYKHGIKVGTSRKQREIANVLGVSLARDN